MRPVPENPNIRRGRFLWAEEPERERYLASLTRKISEGYFFSDKVLGKIVEEIAPAFESDVEEGFAGH